MRGNILASLVTQIYDEVFELVRVFADCKYDPLDPEDSVSWRLGWSNDRRPRSGRYTEGCVAESPNTFLKTSRKLCPRSSPKTVHELSWDVTHSLPAGSGALGQAPPLLCVPIKRLMFSSAFRVLMMITLILRPKFKIWIGGWPRSSAKGSMTTIPSSRAQRYMGVGTLRQVVAPAGRRGQP